MTPTEIEAAESFTAPSAELRVSESLEHANVSPTSTAIKLDIKTDRFGTIRAMYDSGASLNIVDAAWALKNFSGHIKKVRDFYCATANGDIVIRQYLRVRCANQFGGTPFFAKFYLLRNSPHRFIMSRGMFWKMGYKIMRPDGEFVVQSQNEQMSSDLYDNLFKAMDYPLKGETLLVDPNKCANYRDFLCHLSRKHEQWSQRDPLGQFTPRFESVAMPDTWAVVRGNHVCATLDAATAKRWHTRQSHEAARRALPELPPTTPRTRIGLTKEQILEEAAQIHGRIDSRGIKSRFYDLLTADGKLYAAHMADIGVLPDVQFEIHLTNGARPFYAKPYPHSHEKALDSRRQIQELLAGGFIRVSESSWAAPYLMVPKPTRKGKREWRMAIDYRGLNARTRKDRYPIPTMRDLYAKLRGGKIFSCLDLRSGYHHIAVKPEDRPKTAFITEYGLFEWTRMTFGFCNAPSVFQRAMDKVFGDMDNVLVYIDDIVIATETEEEHLKVLTEVFARLRKHGMTLRLIKCKFFQREVKYLGLVVNQDGIRCDEDYVRKVLTFKRPTTIKELERYLGMVAWLGRFIPNLSKLTSALTSMGKKKFEWNDECQRHFEAIQRAVHHAKLLRHPDLNRPFFVQTDASEVALGAVLLQDFGGKHLEPIEFISRKLTDCETRWHCSEQELVAVVYACNRWIKFLLPKPFTVFTDHKNLEILFTKGPGMKSKKLQRWIVQLQQFDFTAKYLPGKDNYIADFLSRDVVLFCTLLSIETQRSDTAAMPKDLDMDLVEFLWLPTPAPTPRQLDGPSLQHVHAVRAYQATCHAVRPRRSLRLSKQERVDYDEEKEVDWSEYGRKRTKSRLMLPEVTSDKDQATKPTLCERDWSRRLGPTRFKRAATRDAELQRLRKAVTTGHGLTELSRDVRVEIAAKRFVVSEDGLVFRKNGHGRPVPLVPTALRADLVEYFHTARVFQHQGYQRTYATMQQWYYWRGMQADVRRFCTECQVCRRTRLSRVNHAQGRTTLVLAERPFQMVSMDLVGPLPICSSGARYLLTIMDRFTRYVAAIPLKEVTARLVAKRFYHEWILRYGVPESLLADNGTQFTSMVLRFTCQLLGIRQRFATIYHPECNGQIERWHRFLKQRLAIRQRESGLRFLYGDDWDDFIPAIVFSYNASVHTITRYSPFQLLYGRLPALPTKLAKLGRIKIPAIRGYEDYLRTFVQTLGVIRNRALQTTYVHRRALDSRLNRDREAFDFEIGELVYRRALGLTGNLASFTDKWLGPYEVVSKTAHGAYQLRHVKQPDDQPLVNGKYLIRLPEAEQNKNLKGRRGS